MAKLHRCINSCSFNWGGQWKKMYHCIFFHCFIWEVISKTRASCFIRSSKYLETMCFSVFKTRDETLAVSFDILPERLSPKIALLNGPAGFLRTKIPLSIYKQTILPMIDYGCIVWHESNKSLSDKLERLQNQTRRVIMRANRTTYIQYMRNTLGLVTLYNRRRWFLRFVFIFKIVNNQNFPKQLEGYLTIRAELQNRNLRNHGTLDVPQSKTSLRRKTFRSASFWFHYKNYLAVLLGIRKAGCHTVWFHFIQFFQHNAFLML